MTKPAATISHPKGTMTEPDGSAFLPTSPNSTTVATGSLCSSPITKPARSAFLSTTPTRAAAIHSSNIAGALVGYVHNISPVNVRKEIN